jgi:hypothetical protein
MKQIVIRLRKKYSVIDTSIILFVVGLLVLKKLLRCFGEHILLFQIQRQFYFTLIVGIHSLTPGKEKF